MQLVTAKSDIAAQTASMQAIVVLFKAKSEGSHQKNTLQGPDLYMCHEGLGVSL